VSAARPVEVIDEQPPHGLVGDRVAVDQLLDAELPAVHRRPHGGRRCGREVPHLVEHVPCQLADELVGDLPARQQHRPHKPGLVREGQQCRRGDVGQRDALHREQAGDVQQRGSAMLKRHLVGRDVLGEGVQQRSCWAWMK